MAAVQDKINLNMTEFWKDLFFLTGIFTLMMKHHKVLRLEQVGPSLNNIPEI